MQMRRGSNIGALQKAERARARVRAARSMAGPGQWQGHHTDDDVEINGASGAGGGYVGVYGGLAAATIGAVTGDKTVFLFSILAIGVVGFFYGVLSGGASSKMVKASVGGSVLYGSLFSFLALIVGVIVSIMVMVPVLMVLSAVGIGRYGS